MADKDVQELARRERNEYHKKWRARNPDKVRAKNQRYWEKKAREREAKGEKT